MFGLTARQQQQEAAATMEGSVGVSLMVMFEDESLEVRYANGAQLQLSPCGSEFMLHGHPPQPTERLRQRSRFAISKYKHLLVAALAFRNRYASQPYLPEELISPESKKPFFSRDSKVHWPDWSPREAELGPGGETVVRSKGGEATLTLASSGEDFTVEFLCNLSQFQKQLHSDNSASSGDRKGDQPDETSPKDNEPTRDSPTFRPQPEPEQMYQSTTVVQHHSCCAVPSMWVHPLSLARCHWSAQVTEAKDEAEGTSKPAPSPDISSEATWSQLPQSLPLTCPSPHRHKWKFKDPLTTAEHSDLPTELLKVMWCQGITYRILKGTVPVIEVSPGDGSVIRSKAALHGYFTHYKYDLQSKQGKEITYHVSSLPPDGPGQVYFISSTVTRASRILACYTQAQQLLQFSVTPSCLKEERQSLSAVVDQEKPSHRVFDKQDVNVEQTADWRSELVAAELEKIKRFNFLLEHSTLQSNEDKLGKLQSTSTDVTEESLDGNCVTEALQRTSKAIQDIEAVISAATLI